MSQVILCAISIGLFTVSLFLPCIEAVDFSSSMRPQPGWLCLIGSASMVGVLSHDGLSLNSLCIAAYFPCNVCVVLLPVCLVRFFRKLSWITLPLLLFGLLVGLCLPFDVFDHDGPFGSICIGYFLWLGAIATAIVFSVNAIRNDRQFDTSVAQASKSAG